jgi:6-pyruvoyltetrahydropterin/6-carboxytetrahydropterin synthase
MERSLIARRLMFSAAHFYRQESFSDEKNRETFGLCYTPHGHGHNYVIEAFIDGPIDPDTKLVVNLTDLDRVLREATEPLEHRHLNFDVPEFKNSSAGKIPTSENIALYLRDRIIKALPSLAPNLKLNRLRLYETDALWVEVIE